MDKNTMNSIELTKKDIEFILKTIRGLTEIADDEGYNMTAADGQAAIAILEYASDNEEW